MTPIGEYLRRTGCDRIRYAWTAVEPAAPGVVATWPFWECCWWWWWWWKVPVIVIVIVIVVVVVVERVWVFGLVKGISVTWAKNITCKK